MCGDVWLTKIVTKQSKDVKSEIPGKKVACA